MFAILSSIIKRVKRDSYEVKEAASHSSVVGLKREHGKKLDV